MIVYSKKIVRFIAEIKALIKSILVNEVHLRVHGDRFYDKVERYSYPIKIVIYNNKQMLGYFAADFLELGFHERLVGVSKKDLVNIVRHELAHYLTFIEHGSSCMPHGPEFKTTCLNLGWGEEVYRATSCLDDGEIASEHIESSILRRVQKLMALASSSNPHEAEQAMIKAHELLLKHNIDAPHIEDEQEKVFLVRVLKQKKECAKMRAIASILDTFFVHTVFSRSDDAIYLELIGSEVNVEIAEYVANFLDIQFETMWEEAKKSNFGLKGTVAKNSFFLGIAKGYCEKVQALKRCYTQALMVIEKKLQDAKSMVYSRLRYSRSSSKHCAQSSKIGEQVGRALHISPALNTPAKKSTLFQLPFFSFTNKKN